MIRLHRWLGFALMIWFVFEALSGAYLAISDQVDRVLHPPRYTATAGDLGPSAAVKAGQSAVADGRASYIYFPASSDGVYQVFVTDADSNQWRVFVDPGTAAVNDVVDPNDDFAVLILRLHADFNASTFLGVSTAAIVGWLGIAWLVTLTLGFLVTRKRRRAVSRRHVFRRGRRRYAFHLDIHNVVGLLLIIPAMAAVLTGLVLEFPSQTGTLISVLAPGDVRDGSGEAVPTSTISSTGTRAPLDAVAASVNAAGYDDIESITVPLGNPAGVFTVFAAGDGISPSQGLFSGRGRTVTVYVDQYTADVISTDDGSQDSVASQIADDWSPSIHFGTWLSWISQLLWVLVGLGTLLLATTALYMRSGRWPWQRKRTRLPDPSLGPPVPTDEDGDPVLEPLSSTQVHDNQL